MSGQTEYSFSDHLDGIKKMTSNKERSRWKSMSRILHPISTLIAFG